MIYQNIAFILASMSLSQMPQNMESIYLQMANNQNGYADYITESINTKSVIETTSDYNIPIDNSIDDSLYYIGGGDVFQITFPGSATSYSGIVNQNGDLLIPQIGIVKIGKISLADAKKTVLDYYSEKLNKKVYVTLMKTKYATITIRGADIKKSGTYKFEGTIRIIDVIRKVNGDTLPSMEKLNFRNILCIGQDSTRHFDLFKYLFKGDKSQNPYIYPGDEIVLEPVKKAVYLNGEVASIRGILPILPDENICDFLDNFAFNESADLENVFIQKSDSINNRSLKVINFKNRENYSLRDKDAISIVKKKNYPEFKMVELSGEVAKRGTYPIIEFSTSANQLLTQAGGVTAFGDMSRAVVLRKNKYVPDDMLNAREVRPEINSAITSMKTRKDYAVVYLKDQDVLLEPGDQIFIPKTESQVYLSGGVKKPGSVPFKNGMSYSYYVKKAGGLQKRADRSNVFVITVYGDVAISKDVDNIGPGDIIVVPIAQQNRRLVNVFLPTLSAVSTTLGVILALFAALN